MRSNKIQPAFLYLVRMLKAIGRFHSVWYCMLICCCFIGLHKAEAQGKTTHQTQSREIIKTPDTDSLLDIASGLINNYPDSALTLFREVLNKADTNISALARAYKGIGIVNSRKGKYRDAHENQQKALELFREVKDSSGIANTYNQKGLIYWKEGSFDLALEYFLKSYELAEKINNRNEISNALNNMGNIYLEQRKFNKAEENYNKSLKIRQELGDEHAIANSINNLGVVHWYNRNYEKALEYYLQLFEIAKKLNDKVKQSNAYTNIAILYSDIEKYDSAHIYYDKAYEIDEQLGNLNGMARIQGNIANTYLRQDKIRQALPHAQKSLELATEINALDLQAYSSEHLYLIHQELNDYENALKYHVLLTTINDSIFNIESSEKIAELEIKYQSEQKEKENELLRKDNKIKQLVINEQVNLRNFVGLVLFLVIIILLIVYSRSRIKSKANRELASKNALITKQKEQISEAFQKLETLNQQLEIQKREIQERADKLKEANATKDKFFSIIAHDLINPFNAILGFAELLNNSDNDLSRSELAEIYEKLEESSKNTYDLLSNLLAWARNQSGKLKLEFEKTQIKSLIEKCVETHQHSARIKNIEIKTVVPSYVYVSIDRNTISSALSNLIGNAVKFTNSGGEVRIELENKDNNLIIHVKDNGIGIEKERLDKLFKVDENISTKGTNNESGTGLGLILVRDFIEANNGRIEVKSTAGVGSDFMVILQKT